MAFSSSAPPNNTDDLIRYLPLYKAVRRGDVNYVVSGNFDSYAVRITANMDTALHVAVGTGRANNMVEHLLTKMSPQEVIIINNDGNTALSVAAIVGNVEAAKTLLKKYIELCGVANHCGWIPVILAARHAHKDMIITLLEANRRAGVPLEKYAIGESGAFFVSLLILSGFYEVALQHVEACQYLEAVPAEGSHGGFNSLLIDIAGKLSAFLSGKPLNFWQRFIYHCIPIDLEFMPIDLHGIPANSRIAPNFENDLSDERIGGFLLCIALLRSVFISVSEKILHPLGTLFISVSEIILHLLRTLFIPVFKEIHELKLMHHQAHQLVKRLCDLATKTPEYARASSILRPPFLSAAQLGVHEVVEQIVLSFPHGVWFTDQENHSLFHLAVMNRQEKVFNLIFQISNGKNLLLMSQDTHGNNILHLAGRLAPQHRLNLISGAALKMQYELKWFKEVEKNVRPADKEDKNSQGKTPAMVFTEAHKELVKEGEKWMKDTASSCSLVAALIATVMFAAAITVPGGNINDNGHPIFLKDTAFIIFGISDVFSLFSSVAALLMFLSILTARYAEDDFLYALPTKLICGLVFLFLSITTMMLAFSATVFLVFCNKKTWMLIPVGVLACLPVSLFASLQFPLLVDMIYSTYGSGNFGRQSKRMLS